MSKLNPSLKILSILWIAIISILCNSLSSHFFILIFIIILIFISNDNVYEYIKHISKLFWTIFFIFIINIFFIGLMDNLIIILRILEISLYTNIVNKCTNIREFNNGIYYLLNKFSFIPAKKIAFSLTLTISFFPNLIKKADKIYNSILSKGFNIKKSSFKTKLFILKSFIISLFYNVFKSADDISYILDLNLFDIDKKNSNYYTYKFHLNDLLFLIFSFLYTFCLLKNEVII